jgi:3-deoxy-7-phosphoheptulonate synthase
MHATSDLRISSVQSITTPRELLAELPASQASVDTVLASREAIRRILVGEDTRMLALVGPCSIHDAASAREYAGRLKSLSDRIADRIFVVMRVYFEKPRTRLGWKGLILDPRLDGSNDIQEGLRQARRIMLETTAAGMPIGSEALDPIMPQYIFDLVSWAAIGARTTESQTHREMASGLSMSVGFKNGTDGSVETAVNAMASAYAPHSFIGMDPDGRTCILNTTGNDLGHIILRGGKDGPNYHREQIEDTQAMLRQNKLPERIVVDCSHANCNKDYRKQAWVIEEVIQHRRRGFSSVKGFMLESHLRDGRQDIPAGPDPLSRLEYGLSVTDPCLGWESTSALLLDAFAQLGE